MKRIALNIGTKGSPLGWIDMTRYVSISHGVVMRDFDKKTGEYNGQPEETALMEFNIDMDGIELQRYLELLCLAFQQECIAVYDYDNSSGYLVYNPTFNGKRLEFDKSKFIEL